MNQEFSIQFKSFRDKVFRFAKSIVNDHEDAKDIVQDLFEKLWNMRDELNKYNNMEALSIKMTRNLCLDKLKHEKQKRLKLQDMALNGKTQPDGKDYEQKDTSEVIRSLINQLPDKQKMIIHLRDVEGYEYPEIAEIMDMDINAVRMNLSRGRKTIKERLIKTMNYGL